LTMYSPVRSEKRAKRGLISLGSGKLVRDSNLLVPSERWFVREQRGNGEITGRKKSF